ncbi:hypothetical protein [Stieleria varia]|uniref:Uncharacterized protein n=1 Tax=Stieleria varia TaxID=2528005 RepID=A0A5C6A209_9BACT|nr:hypothetical protein [Stieleria varia]TWT93268.1 hypothetical protein Pla52n_59280 [Stieleria varia]
MQPSIELIESVGCKPRKPTSTKAAQRYFDDMGIASVKPLARFYETCNGGKVKRLGCRFYPLSEAVFTWSAFDFTMDLRFLPFFVSENNESDPVVVGIDGPIRGLVFQMCHDNNSRILAPNIPAFLRSLKSQDDDIYFAIEDNSFVYPKNALTKAEETTFAKLMARTHENQYHDSEASRITELALSMVNDSQLVDLLDPLPREDRNSQFYLKRRLDAIGSKKAKALAKKVSPALK